MKVYTFEIGKKVYEYYDLRSVKKQAKQIAKEQNNEVLITMIFKGKISAYTMYPNGEFVIDGLNHSFNN